MQPLQELVDSERSYVQRLTLVKEKYIPALESQLVEIPDDLASKWRIVWGNWAQLHDWHAAFLEKLERCHASDPDEIPALLVDCRSRLRFIYAKYCENHRKAVLIAETHRQVCDLAEGGIEGRRFVRLSLIGETTGNPRLEFILCIISVRFFHLAAQSLTQPQRTKFLEKLELLEDKFVHCQTYHNDF